MPRLTFAGAARTVTGSRFLLELRGVRVLVDCGLFQGPPAIRERNREPFPVDPSAIDAVILTHAHVDHCGWLPRLSREGFDGPVFVTPPTRALCGLLLPDAAALQEEEARRAKKHGHGDPEPLYDEGDAKGVLRRFVAVRFGEDTEVRPGLHLTFRRAGHILGAAFADLSFKAGGATRRIVISGDLGRKGIPILHDPEQLPACDLLLLESTYGGRHHDPRPARELLAEALAPAFAAGGFVLIPAFAVGRVQEVLHDLATLRRDGKIPEWPVYVDSPMAASATRFYDQFKTEHDLEMTTLVKDGRDPFHGGATVFVRTREESKALNSRQGRAIVISPSGMASGGRVLHHLRRRLPDPATTILFVGYQAAGTRGRQLVEGAQAVEIEGTEIPVHARIVQIGAYSAHADEAGLVEWVAEAAAPPSAVALIHGEPESAEALSATLSDRLGVVCAIPHHLESFDL